MWPFQKLITRFNSKSKKIFGICVLKITKQEKHKMCLNMKHESSATIAVFTRLFCC